jgi:hypothetical protein
MKTQSNEKQPKFDYLADKIYINFNEQIKEVEDSGETQTIYEYETAIVRKTCDYKDRVEAIVAVRYPTYGAELAAMRDTEKAIEHNEFVEFAKALAHESMEVK